MRKVHVNRRNLLDCFSCVCTCQTREDIHPDMPTEQVYRQVLLDEAHSSGSH